MLRFLRLCLFSAVAAPAMGQVPIESSLRSFAIQVVNPTFYRDGSCKFQLILTNFTGQTLNVVANVVLVNGDKVSIGSRPGFFPPVLPFGRSVAETAFYRFALAANCNRPVTVVVQPEVCQLSDGRYLPNQSCRISDQMTFERK